MSLVLAVFPHGFKFSFTTFFSLSTLIQFTLFQHPHLVQQYRDCVFDYSHPPVRLGVRRWPHPPPPLLTSLAWNDPRTVAWSHLRKEERENPRLHCGLYLLSISWLCLLLSCFLHPKWLIYKQLGFNLLVFSLSSGASPRHNVGGWVLPVHSQQTLLQGVVTYMSPVEAFATAIKFFDWQKVCLIAFWGSWSLDFQGSKVTCYRAFLIVDF